LQYAGGLLQPWLPEAKAAEFTIILLLKKGIQVGVSCKIAVCGIHCQHFNG
jgi:hypothetical protein